VLQDREMGKLSKQDRYIMSLVEVVKHKYNNITYDYTANHTALFTLTIQYVHRVEQQN